MRYLGFSSTLGLMRTLSFGFSDDDSLDLPDLIINMIAPVKTVDPEHVDIDIYLPAPPHPYQ